MYICCLNSRRYFLLFIQFFSSFVRSSAICHFLVRLKLKVARESWAGAEEREEARERLCKFLKHDFLQPCIATRLHQQSFPLSRESFRESFFRFLKSSQRIFSYCTNFMCFRRTHSTASFIDSRHRRQKWADIKIPHTSVLIFRPSICLSRFTWLHYRYTVCGSLFRWMENRRNVEAMLRCERKQNWFDVSTRSFMFGMSAAINNQRSDSLSSSLVTLSSAFAAFVIQLIYFFSLNKRFDKHFFISSRMNELMSRENISNRVTKKNLKNVFVEFSLNLRLWFGLNMLMHPKWTVKCMRSTFHPISESNSFPLHRTSEKRLIIIFNW